MEHEKIKYLTPKEREDVINKVYPPTIGILDIETGGFSTTKNGVCEIALLIVGEDLTPIEEYTWLIKPYTRADDTDEMVSYKDDAMAVHGIAVEQLQVNGMEVVLVCEGLLEALDFHRVRLLVGHNLKAFDIPRVDHLTTRFVKKSIKNIPAACTLEAAKHYIAGAGSYKLEELCAQLGIKQVIAHRALSDCYSTLGLLSYLREKGLKINQTPPARHGME